MPLMSSTRSAETLFPTSSDAFNEMNIDHSLHPAGPLRQRQRRAKAEQRVQGGHVSLEAMSAVRLRHDCQNARKASLVPICGADKCRRSLMNAYSKKCRLCTTHLRASIISVAGVASRWCQKCSKVHVVSEFDDERKSCRDALRRHNARQKALRSMGNPLGQQPRATHDAAKAPAPASTDETVLIETTGYDYSLSSDTALEVPIYSTDLSSGFDVLELELAAAAVRPESLSPQPTSEELLLIEQCWGEWGLDELESPGGLPPVVKLPDGLPTVQSAAHRPMTCHRSLTS